MLTIYGPERGALIPRQVNIVMRISKQMRLLDVDGNVRIASNCYCSFRTS